MKCQEQSDILQRWISLDVWTGRTDVQLGADRFLTNAVEKDGEIWGEGWL